MNDLSIVYLFDSRQEEKDIRKRNRTETLHRISLKMSMTTNEQMSTEENSSQNSRTSSMAESTEGFSNYTEIIQHLQTSTNLPPPPNSFSLHSSLSFSLESS